MTLILLMTFIPHKLVVGLIWASAYSLFFSMRDYND